MKTFHDNPMLSERIIQKSDSEWEFIEKPFSPQQLRWIMEYLQGLDCKVLHYRQCKLRLPKVLSALKSFMELQEHALCTVGRSYGSEKDQDITKAGRAYARWMCEWDISCSGSPLEVLPIALRILRVPKTRNDFSSTVLQAMEHMASTVFVDHFKDFLTLCSRRLGNPQHEESDDLSKLYDRIYLPQPGTAGDSLKLAEKLLLLEQIEPVAENEWRLKDIPQSREVFYRTIDALYKEDSRRILRYSGSDIDVGRVWKTLQELLKKQRHAMSEFSKFRPKDWKCEERLEWQATAIGEAYARLMSALGDMHCYAGPYVRHVDRLLLDHADFRNAVLMGFRQKIFGQESKIQDIGFLKKEHQMTLDFVRFLKSSGI